MLIGFSGRKKSGKTTLANQFIKQGFKIASFAEALKEYVAKLYGWDIESLKNQAQKEEVLADPVYWNKDKCKELSDIIGEEIKWNGKINIFYSRRDAMQYIGTEVLREHNPDFHINEFKKRYTNGDFVCDDVRFLNELDLIDEINGFVCHITRPYNWEYSNHSSEVSLNRINSKFNILNNGSLEDFVIKLDDFWKDPSSYKETQPKCSKFIDFNVESAYWAGFIHTYGKIIPKDEKYILRLKTQSEECKKFIDYLGLKDFEWECRKGVDFYSIDIDNCYLIEDLKLWNIDDKFDGRKVQCPELINNKELADSWLKGKGVDL